MKAKRKTPYDNMTVAEFKERIKAICGIRPPNPLLLRNGSDHRINPAPNGKGGHTNGQAN
jgi:hypothetical protein